MTKMYRAIDVWARLKGRTVVRYRCLQSLNNGKYCVQSADFYHDGKKPTELNSDNQFIELLTEQDPARRAGEHDTLEAAIAAHNRDFEGMQHFVGGKSRLYTPIPIRDGELKGPVNTQQMFVLTRNKG